MDMKLLQKIEELTLYMIDFEKKMEKVQEENQKLKERIAELEKR
jgi:cell division septum initiation protein DivIVA